MVKDNLVMNNAWRPLPMKARNAAVVNSVVARKLFFLISSELMGVCLPKPWLRSWLDVQMNRHLDAGRMDEGFFFPVSYVLKAYPGYLRFLLPARMLETRLWDWVTSGDRVIHTGDYFLFRGDWSGLLHKAERTRTFQEARAVHAVGLSFRDSVTYREDLQQIKRGKPLRRNKVSIDTPELLDQYYQRFVKLFLSIQKHGVLSLAEARSREPGFDLGSAVRDWKVSRGEREIGVAIGPQGEIVVLPGGKHRLAIASVLGIDQVPVELRMVHCQWAENLAGNGGWIERMCGGFKAVVESARGLN